MAGFSICVRSSRPEVFCKKGVFRNFTEFIGKHLCQSLFWPATLLKKRLWHRCFPENFLKFLRTPFLKEHLWWLLLMRALHSVLNIPESLRRFSICVGFEYVRVLNIPGLSICQGSEFLGLRSVYQFS